MRGGFSLIEVLVVLVILSITAGITAPTFLIERDDPLIEVTDEVTSVIRQAREAALKRGLRMQLTIESSSGRWWLDSDPATRAASAHGQIPRLPMLRTGGAEVIRYRISDLGVAAGTPVVLSSPEQRVTLTVNGWSGDVEVQ